MTLPHTFQHKVGPLLNKSFLNGWLHSKEKSVCAPTVDLVLSDSSFLISGGELHPFTYLRKIFPERLLF